MQKVMVLGTHQTTLRLGLEGVVLIGWQPADRAKKGKKWN
jgi:hypothetical protein